MNNIYVIYYNNDILKIHKLFMPDFDNFFERKEMADAMIEKIYEQQPCEPRLHFYKNHFTIEVFTPKQKEELDNGLIPLHRGKKFPNYRCKTWRK